jgi:pyruvate/2-oxoglutarate dehydrogenase complex dihydrolipoamide acyltransferase (E2) component
VPYPRYQHEQIEWLDLMQRRHTVHGLLECDVTEARRLIRERRAATGEALSLTAYLVACFARAIAADPGVQAYRLGRDRLIVFDDVDVTVLVESDVEGARIPVPHIVRAAQRKTAASISREIRAAQSKPVPYGRARSALRFWLWLPRPLRVAFWRLFLADPRRRKRFTGTAVVTSVGMFGRGTAWAIPMIDHTIGLAVGGIDRRPGLVHDVVTGAETVATREYLALTVSVDHDVVDGAPAARFAMRLKDLIGSGDGLPLPA